MKTKFSIFAILVALSLVTACADDESVIIPTPPPAPERMELNYTELAQALNTDFEAFATANAAYCVTEKTTDDVLVLGATFNTGAASYDCTVQVTKDADGTIKNIVATPEDPAADKELYAFHLNNSEALSLGNWVGTKYNTVAPDGTSSGGIYQTIDESLACVANATDLNAITVYAMYAIVSGKAYAVVSVEDGRFKMQLMDSYYSVDFDVLASMIGDDIQGFITENYIIGSKMSFFGTNYFLFYNAYDALDNLFSLEANTTTDWDTITSFKLALDYANTAYTPEEQMAIWQKYAEGDAALNLGTFHKAYTSSFGQTSEFADHTAFLEYVATENRPGDFDPDIIVEWAKQNAIIKITLKAMYIYIDVLPAE